MTLAYLIDDAFDPDQPVPRGIKPDEQDMLRRLRKQLRRKQSKLRIKEKIYEAKQFVRYMDVSIPPMFQAVAVALAWPGAVIDAYEERIDFRGWLTPKANGLGLKEMYDDNFLGIETSRSTFDKLIFGQGFLALGAGDPSNDEPDILITAESALQTTTLWNYRTRRADAAYSQTYDERNRIIMETLWMLNSTITLERDSSTGGMVVTDVDDHNFNRVPVVRATNRDRASNPNGRSDITPPIRYATEAAIRTALGMEINREFYTTPATFALNVRPEMFGIKDLSTLTDAEKARMGWSIMAGHINLVPPKTQPTDGDPDVKQLTPQDPTPYLDQIKGYANMVQSASGLPQRYLGFAEDLAGNADAIRAEDYPMVRRVERRIAGDAQTYRQLAWLACLWRDQEPPDTDTIRQVRCNFADPNVPLRSAIADETQKYVAAKVLAPNGAVVYNRIGLSDEEAAQNNEDIKAWNAQQVEQAKAMAEVMPKPAVGGSPGGVDRNGNQGVPAAAKSPTNVTRGRAIAGRAGQGSAS